MREDYLWDRSGEPDPQVVRLEHLLAPYRCPRDAPALRPAGRQRLRPLLAVAATVVLALLLSRPGNRTAAPSNWAVEGAGGAARQVRQGETIETREAGVRLDAPAVGEVHVQPHSRLRVLRSGAGQERMALARGALHALIWAPPQRFVVDTPSATTIDLGCEYDLRVLEDGSGFLTVVHGWVAFQAGAAESFIPAGAACRTWPRRGPGLPFYEDATPAFRDAVAAFDARGGSLDAILAQAVQRDALTLWHLLGRTAGADRDRVAARFRELIPDADTTHRDAAWNALGLGDTEWWRTWKRRW